MIICHHYLSTVNGVLLRSKIAYFVTNYLVVLYFYVVNSIYGRGQTCIINIKLFSDTKCGLKTSLAVGLCIGRVSSMEETCCIYCST